ncbi:MAG: TlpA family protein disulfide reductase, partial [Deltaproteobacteria bacterium]|nr:TlpA family protein disulfide reductase [Deltaproteobacteria bacterium]
APTFTVTDEAGKPVTLADFAGKPVLVNVWASWCAPCLQELPEMDKLAARLAGTGAVVLAINIDDKAENGKRMKTKLALTHLRVAFDPGKTVPKAFGVDAMPSSFVIDGGGVIRHVNRGYQAGDVEKMEAVIRGLQKP